MGADGGIRPNYLAKLLAIIRVHNHPSGEPEPSNEDIAITKRVVDGCNLRDMTVLDHIVIGKTKGDYVSLRDKGLIKGV